MHVALVHMRVAGTGGTEAYLNYVAKYLVELGHQVTVICRSFENKRESRIQFVVLRRFAPTPAARMVGFVRDVEKHLRTMHYDVVFGLGKTCSQDVIRLGGGCHATYLENAHASTLGVWERWLSLGNWKQARALAIEARALAPGAARRVIVNSEMVKRDVIARYGLVPEIVEVVYNGVELERFRPDAERRAAIRRECGFSQDAFVLLFLGTGYGRKGLDVLLSAFSKFVRERPDARLLVVGYDSAQSVYKKRAVRLQCEDRVCFLGGRRDSEAIYAAADIYVLPTRYDPFANTTLEALASGLPVITTVNNGGGELIQAGVHGEVISTADDEEALLEALRCWRDPERIQTGKQSARKLAEAHSSRAMAQRSLEILEAVAREKRAAKKDDA